MSISAPPPVSASSQKCAACGPECASRERIVKIRPIAPSSIMRRTRITAGEKTSVSA